VLFRQFVDDDLGCASYLLGDPAAGEAVAVDPPYALEPLVEASADAGVRIVRVLETHNHADHVSGHGRLALEHGAAVAIHPLADPEYPFEPLEDGSEVRVGATSIRVLHTPGHRPEHCSFVIPGELVLTGDSLFVGDAARPDLAVGAEEGAAGLFRSLRRLAELPDAVSVYPGHVAGSLCGGSMSSDRHSTIGAERRSNPMLGISELSRFVAASAAVSAPRPPTVARCVALNRGPFLAARPPLEPVDDRGGATVLDVRDAQPFAAGHVAGAINVPLSGSAVGTKAAFVLPHGPVVIHAATAADAETAAQRLRAVGLLDEPVGYVLDPPGATARLEPMARAELLRLVETEAVSVLDVREPAELAAGTFPGAVNVPYRVVAEAPVEGGRPVVTICETGARATIAASLLVRRGIDARPVLDGGFATSPGARGARTTPGPLGARA
jgi:glyoxylase-like metal-dependent hydrolase (beta-lactamase superfamily II)/rhodanese-related sulfurtransferase